MGISRCNDIKIDSINFIRWSTTTHYRIIYVSKRAFLFALLALLAVRIISTKSMALCAFCFIMNEWCAERIYLSFGRVINVWGPAYIILRGLALNA